jgi:hypothetical protein
MELFLVKVFTEGKKVVGKAFLSKKRFLVKILVILWLFFGMTIEDFEKPPKTSGNSTKVYKEESVTRSKSKFSIVFF